jgi:hypothetical protein
MDGHCMGLFSEKRGVLPCLGIAHVRLSWGSLVTEAVVREKLAAALGDVMELSVSWITGYDSSEDIPITSSRPCHVGSHSNVMSRQSKVDTRDNAASNVMLQLTSQTSRAQHPFRALSAST